MGLTQRQRAALTRNRYAAARVAVWRRDGGRCLHCGRRGEQTHHRKPRRMGGATDDVAAGLGNLVLVCRVCHERIESARLVSHWDGWIVGANHNPTLVPLRTRDGWVWLDDAGGVTPCDPPSLT